MKRLTGMALIAALAAFGAAACSNDRDEMYENDRPSTAAEDAERAGERAGEEAREAGDEAGDVMDDAAAATDAAAQTAQIKTKLAADDTIDATDINVDTNGETRTVTLKGVVETEAQRAAAERIAKETAPEYRVVNLLTVSGESSSQE